MITLVIVGVVASLTVPNMIIKHQKEETVTRLKKAYSALSQTTNLAISDNGPIDSWEIVSGNYTSEVAIDFFQKFMKPYLSISKDCGTNTNGVCDFQLAEMSSPSTFNSLSSQYERFFLSDGTFVALSAINMPPYIRATIYIDVNGKKSPNRLGRDVFYYEYNIATTNTNLVGKMIPYGGQFSERNGLLDYCNKNSHGRHCAALIMKDGWRIADDYPW